MSKKMEVKESGFLNLLTVLFIGLKLTNQIGWSWFLVLSPMLIPFIAAGLCIVVISVCETLKD